MRIATWNVNSIRVRASRVLDWMIRERIDVLAMQEIKCKPEQFPAALFEQAGYHLAIHGLNQWNGVAFVSRHELSEVTRGFAGMPGFDAQQSAATSTPGSLPLEARALGVTVCGLRLWSLYVPNGRSLNDPHFGYKLAWLRALRSATGRMLTRNPQRPLALLGDWNIAPLPEDVGDPSYVVGTSTHVSPQERELFESFMPPLQDVVRPFAPEGYTFWDYQRRSFARNIGLRIDFILASPTFAEAVTAASIHRDQRQGEQPSDHVPVVCDLDQRLCGERGLFGQELEGELSAVFDDRPMVFE